MKDIIAVIEEAAASAELTATKKAAAQKKLIALAIDPFLVSLPLERARRIFSGASRNTIESLLLKMTMKQLKAASKKWNADRPAFAKETALAEVRDELIYLLKGGAPHQKAAKAKKKAASK